jgi:hypothetical protein
MQSPTDDDRQQLGAGYYDIQNKEVVESSRDYRELKKVSLLIVVL